MSKQRRSKEVTEKQLRDQFKNEYGLTFEALYEMTLSDPSSVKDEMMGYAEQIGVTVKEWKSRSM
mgnify:CR=1 FL=1